MPAVITHELFGRDAYERLHDVIGDTSDQQDAFLLGCQGPDVLFFCSLSPSFIRTRGLGSRMHQANPDELLSGFIDAVGSLVDDARPVGEAYLRGLLCHYLLDSKMHPFIYAQQYALCDAGIAGLDRTDGHEVHAEIESELDVLTLTAKRGETIETFDPSTMTLQGNDRTLRIISCLYRRVANEVFDTAIPTSAYEQGAKAYRRALSVLRSPTNVKRTVMGRMERLVRRHSFLHAMSHRNELLTESPFDNHDHLPWVDPATGKTRTDGFWDIYDRTLSLAVLLIPGFVGADRKSLARITNGLDFNGMPTRPLIVEVTVLE